MTCAALLQTFAALRKPERQPGSQHHQVGPEELAYQQAVREQCQGSAQEQINTTTLLRLGDSLETDCARSCFTTPPDATTLPVR